MIGSAYSNGLSTSLDNLVAWGEAWNEIVRLSPMVIALRTDAALAGMADPASVPAGESLRMVAEKIDAAAQGAVAATLESGLALGRVMRGMENPIDAAFDVAQAAVAPARRRLRSNVCRLGGPWYPGAAACAAE